MKRRSIAAVAGCCLAYGCSQQNAHPHREDGHEAASVAPAARILAPGQKQGTCPVCGKAVDGSVCHTAVLPAGGEYFTNDIAVGLSTPLSEAEGIKTRYGCVVPALIDDDQAIEAPGIGGRGPRLLPRRRLCEILEPRAAEILDLVRDEISQAGFLEQLNAGLVLTGGGALLGGLAETAEHRFGMPVRIGVPCGVEGLVDIVSSPIYSTAVGLTLYGHYNRGMGTYFDTREEGVLRRFTGRVSRWFGELF